MTTSTITERDFRDAMGSFATGVCVLGAKRRDGASVAITVNSFTSVSLDPPLVLVCLGTQSPRTNALVDSGRFSISMLADHQREVSNRFAQPGEGLMPGSGWHEGENGTPLIDGSAALIECDVETTHDAGDHLILIGRVTRLESDPGREALVYFRGGYRLLDGAAD